jgi:hypothetical protein
LVLAFRRPHPTSSHASLLISRACGRCTSRALGLPRWCSGHEREPDRLVRPSERHPVLVVGKSAALPLNGRAVEPSGVSGPPRATMSSELADDAGRTARREAQGRRRGVRRTPSCCSRAPGETAEVGADSRRSAPDLSGDGARALLHPQARVAGPVERVARPAVGLDLENEPGHGHRRTDILRAQLQRRGSGRGNRWRNGHRGGDSEDDKDALHGVLPSRSIDTSSVGALGRGAARARDTSYVTLVTDLDEGQIALSPRVASGGCLNTESAPALTARTWPHVGSVTRSRSAAWRPFGACPWWGSAGSSPRRS